MSKYRPKNWMLNTEKMKVRILKALGDDFLTTKQIAKRIGYTDKIFLTRLYLRELAYEGKIVKQNGYFPKWTAC